MDGHQYIEMHLISGMMYKESGPQTITMAM